MKIASPVCVTTLSFFAGMAFQVSKSQPAAKEPAHVTGIGGIFFKSADPAKLTAWYEKHLGIKPREGAQPSEPPMFEWREKNKPETIGVTVWSLFPKNTRYFEPSRAPFMINYRVDNLDRMRRQLREAGVQVDDKVSDEFNGRFGWPRIPREIALSCGNPSRRVFVP